MKCPRLLLCVVKLLLYSLSIFHHIIFIFASFFFFLDYHSYCITEYVIKMQRYGKINISMP